jgi:Tfp pilus assembly protein PilO
MKKVNVNFADVFRNMRLSLLEWIALGATVIYVGVVAFYFLNSAQPLRSRLSELRAREKALQNQIVDDKTKMQLLNEQRDNRDKILDSLSSFERRLHHRNVGITAVIDEVNQLAKANRVEAGDISYRSDAPAPLPGQATPGASPGTTPTPVITQRDKLPTVYEGLGIDTTVEGDYHDLRRFIAALERSRNFVIINAIALQSIDEKLRNKMSNLELGDQPNPGNPAVPQRGQGPGMNAGGGGASDAPTRIVVSLKIEMETHFARDEKLEAAPKPLNANAPAPKQ